LSSGRDTAVSITVIVGSDPAATVGEGAVLSAAVRDAASAIPLVSEIAMGDAVFRSLSQTGEEEDDADADGAVKGRFCSAASIRLCGGTSKAHSRSPSLRE
jgi:hypothetical protein